MLSGDAVFVDIETNGGNGPRGRVIEVAAIKVAGGEIVDTFTSLINPGSDVPYWITKLTGITNRDLVDAPYFEDIATQLYDFMKDPIFVAHNVLFDYSFLKREFAAAGYDFKPKLFCTVKMSRALWPEHRGHSLEKIINRHNIAFAARHRAYDDAKAMYDFVKLTIAEKGREALMENIARQLKTKSLPPNVDEAVILDLPDSPGVYIFEDDSGAPLYVGKSVNIRTRVRSHFANATTIAKELKMTLASHNVSFITTDTEVEALLLESAKIKELQPMFNRLLRRKTKQSVFLREFNDDGYETIRIENTDLSQHQSLENIYGVYTTKSQAKARLEVATRTFQLCPKLLGLEKAKGACFRYQLGLCKGACIGKESPKLYNRRVELALEHSKIESWPFKSEVTVRISDTRSIIVDQWIVKSVVEHAFDEPTFTLLESGFDIDTYKIIRSYIRKHPEAISLVTPSA
ncbi:MAG TPA: exonuclease domain-containing protein [Candidatus Saccharimonadales bacterium]